MHPIDIAKLNEFLGAAREHLNHLEDRASGSQDWEIIQIARCLVSACQSIVELELERIYWQEGTKGSQPTTRHAPTMRGLAVKKSAVIHQIVKEEGTI